ncbi:hypothetical protein [Paucibacter sp. KCTC 42545]|uniref:hypothetical protein n=1 Tax=Paucibacter sp. KCTC 42545 TaxID=1768242 RepID=UPI0012E37FB9|nr:hypothetical protein [Paucibacter sp. KCTC 42545]
MDDPKLTTLAKQIGDLDDLVQAVRRGTPGTQTWQRLLSEHLDEINGMMQILRMTVVMARPDSEVRDAALALHGSCRRTSVAMSGTRIDTTCRMAVQLALGLSQEIKLAVESINTQT